MLKDLMQHNCDVAVAQGYARLGCRSIMEKCDEYGIPKNAQVTPSKQTTHRGAGPVYKQLSFPATPTTTIRSDGQSTAFFVAQVAMQAVAGWINQQRTHHGKRRGETNLPRFGVR